MKKKDYSQTGLKLMVEVRVPLFLVAKLYIRVRGWKIKKVSAYYKHIGVRK